MPQDTIDIEILPDGRLKVTTDQISPANHVSADELLKGLDRLCGGGSVRQKRARAHAHQHAHGEHTHEH